jgi:hypothetical protein
MSFALRKSRLFPLQHPYERKIAGLCVMMRVLPIVKGLRRTPEYQCVNNYILCAPGVLGGEWVLAV